MMIPDGTPTTRRIPLQTVNQRRSARCGRSRHDDDGQARPRIVEVLISELFDLACHGSLPRETAARRPKCHIRQITMYLCRVVLSMPYQRIASGLGRDRATVIHGCAVVEDRRDNPAYDAFVERCERCVRAIFQDSTEENARAAK